jgi:hypothetical protein
MVSVSFFSVVNMCNTLKVRPTEVDRIMRALANSILERGGKLREGRRTCTRSCDLTRRHIRMMLSFQEGEYAVQVAGRYNKMLTRFSTDVLIHVTEESTFCASSSRLYSPCALAFCTKETLLESEKIGVCR